jgi:hypothetical protein
LLRILSFVLASQFEEASEFQLCHIKRLNQINSYTNSTKKKKKSRSKLLNLCI